MHDEPLLDCRVLIADDMGDTQRLFACILRTAGAMVTISRDGVEAVELALALPVEFGDGRRILSEPYDVILMDMNMPIMNGYEATRRLRAAGYNGPIIALTAYTEEHDQKSCLEAGCDEYVAKPVERHELIELVRRHAIRAATNEPAMGKIG
ncbi:MAG: response regulator [Pirellulales bacterium]|nr:response regulator [Pirellulales bacterium]